MTKQQKRLDKVRQNPRNVSLDDFEALARQFGSIKEGTEHPRVIITTQASIPYKRESPVKKCYVDELLEAIEKSEKNEHGGEDLNEKERPQLLSKSTLYNCGGKKG